MWAMTGIEILSLHLWKKNQLKLMKHYKMNLTEQTTYAMMEIRILMAKSFKCDLNLMHCGLCGQEFKLVNILRIHMKTLREYSYNKTLHKLNFKVYWNVMIGNGFFVRSYFLACSWKHIFRTCWSDDSSK